MHPAPESVSRISFKFGPFSSSLRKTEEGDMFGDLLPRAGSRGNVQMGLVKGGPPPLNDGGTWNSILRSR